MLGAIQKRPLALGGSGLSALKLGERVWFERVHPSFCRRLIIDVSEASRCHSGGFVVCGDSAQRLP